MRRQIYLLLKIWVRRKKQWNCCRFVKLKWAWAKLVEEWKNLSRQCVIISAMDECEKAGELCPSALLCLKQEDGSFACDCDANSKVVGEGDARTCQGTDYWPSSHRFCPSDLAYFCLLYEWLKRNLITRRSPTSFPLLLDPREPSRRRPWERG